MDIDITQHIWWYLGRSSGFVAYWLLFASVAMGLAVSSRVFDGVLGRPWVYEIHKFLSIFVLGMMVFHALIMLPDPYAKFSIGELLIPFRSEFRSTAMAAGIFTLYASLFITGTFYIKGLIGQKMWRWIHYLTFGLFISAMGHGIWTGTDSGKEWVQYSYLASAVAVVFLTFFRILASRSARPKVVPARAAAARAEAQAEAA
jgi:predicted ferric reductase